jgi:hypothetical protein
VAATLIPFPPARSFDHSTRLTAPTVNPEILTMRSIAGLSVRIKSDGDMRKGSGWKKGEEVFDQMAAIRGRRSAAGGPS